MTKERKRDVDPPLCAIKLIDLEWADDTKTLMRMVYDPGGGPPITRLMSEAFARDCVASIARLLKQKPGSVSPLRAGDWPSRH